MSRFSRYLEGFHRTPDPSNDPIGYAKAVATIVRKAKIDVVLPTQEDVIALLENGPHLPSSVPIAAPTLENVRLGMDKGRLARVALEAGIPTPRTLVPASYREAESYLDTASVPLVVKPRRGTGGRGVRLVKGLKGSGRSYREYCDRDQLAVEQLPIIQDFVEGAVVGCGFLSVNGKLIATFTERYLRSKSGATGSSVFRVPIEQPRLECIAATFCEATKWHGVGHMDFIFPSSGDSPLLIDLNPRLWGAVSLAVANGMNFPLAAIELAKGESAVGRHFNRTAIPRASQWIAGELMLCAEHAKARHWKKVFTSLADLWPTSLKSYDDVQPPDIMPLIAELAYYAHRYCQLESSRLA